MDITDDTLEKFLKDISFNKNLEFFDIPREFKDLIRKTEEYTQNPLNPNVSSILSNDNYTYVPSVACDKYILQTLDLRCMKTLMRMEGIKESNITYNIDYLALEDILISLEDDTLEGVIKIRNDAKVDFLIFDRKMDMKAAIDLSFVTKLVIIDTLGKSKEEHEYELVRDHTSFHLPKEPNSVPLDLSKETMEEINRNMMRNDIRTAWEEEDEEFLKPEKKKKREWELEY